MLTPTADNVLIEIITRSDQFAAEVKARSGLITPDNLKQDEPDRGRVVAIGQDVKDPGYKVGDLVVFHTREIFQGFKFDGKNLVTMRDSEIMAVIEEGV